MSETTTNREETGTTTGIDASDRHRLLADDQRRAVIAALSERADAVTLTELAADVADRTDDPTGREDVAVQLHHVHLPMLAEVGVVDYRRTDSRVEPHCAIHDLAV